MRPRPLSTASLCGAALALLAAGPAQAQTNVKGAWSAPILISGLDGTHATLLHTGKVLFLPHRESPSGLTTSALFNPLSPSPVKYQTVPQNWFCGGNSQLPDGRVLFNGGETIVGPASLDLKASGTYDPVTETWSEQAFMKRRRWYPSSLQMGDGRVWTFGGMSEAGEDNPDNTIEIYDHEANTWTLAGGQNLPGQWEEAYNRLHLLPDGHVFQSGHLPNTYRYNPTQKTWTFVDQTNLGKPRGDGAAVRLQDGRIMIVGGQDLNDYFSSAEIIDLDAPNPQWAWLPSMKVARAFITATMLPDGRVLVVGGDEATGPMNRTPELYDPVANTWTNMAQHSIPRGYHATALLLPDARVMIASGEGQNGPGLYEESDRIELWSPPYLFQTPRPVIQSLANSASYGQQLSMSYSSSVPVQSVVLHRTGSSTHSFNYNQISVPVSLDADTGSSLSFTIPSNPNLLPAGYYMAFLMSADGVPSVAEWVRIDGSTPPTGPSFDVAGLAGGSSATLTAEGLTPGAPIAMGYSLLGAGPLPVVVACGSAVVELNSPVLLGLPVADATGRATLVTPFIPASATGLSIWFDALDFQSCVSPPGIAATIQ